MCSMQLNYSKEAIDSEFDLFENTTECDWFLPVGPLFHLFVCKYILYVQQIANVCVCEHACVRLGVSVSCVCASVHACVCVCACECVYDALPEHRNLISSYSKAGTPGHQRNMLTSLRIRTCMVLSHD